MLNSSAVVLNFLSICVSSDYVVHLRYINFKWNKIIMVVVLYTNNKLFTKKIKTISYKIASKPIKEVGTNVTKVMKNLYSKKYEI